MASKGKRAGAKRARSKPPSGPPMLVGLAAGVTLAAVAWGYLVYAAVDFGASARAGDSRAWWFLLLASLGAVACLFAGLMLVVRLLGALGITQPTEPTDPTEQPSVPTPDHQAPAIAVPRPPGGRRAAR